MKEDYVGHVTGYGGSAPGRVVIKPERLLKHSGDLWAVRQFCEGDESVMHYGHVPRFSARLYLPLVELHKVHFPVEYVAYYEAHSKEGNREYASRSNEEYYAHLIMNRIHKMYYKNNGICKNRCTRSREHWGHWSDAEQAENLRRMNEAGWPR